MFPAASRSLAVMHKFEPYCHPEVAVPGKPVSCIISLVSGKNTGKLTVFETDAAKAPREK